MNLFAIILLIIFVSPISFAQTFSHGSYEVPIPESQKELTLYSVFPFSYTLQGASIKDSVLTFTMPRTLVDGNKEFSMKQNKDNPSFWSGSNVSGECEKSVDEVHCLLHFDNLDIDSKKTATFTRSMFSALEAEQRIKVSEIFKSEPIGIIIFKK